MAVEAAIRALCLALVVLAPILCGSEASAQGPASGELTPRLRGFHVAGEYYFSNQQQLANPTAEWLDYLQRTGVDWVGVSISMFSDSLADPTVRVRFRAPGESPDLYRTFTDEQLIGFTQALHARGIRVYWTLAFDQPVLDLARTLNCGTPAYNAPRYMLGLPSAPRYNNCISSSAWYWEPTHPRHAELVALFFNSMTQVALRYARLAQASGVEMYSLGTETEWLWRTRSAYTIHFRPQLQAMVDVVRTAYGGLLTYDQHISAARYLWENDSYIPVFADLGLDVIGVSFYDEILPTAPNAVASVAALTAGWLQQFDTFLSVMKTANNGKPLILTEFGFVNSVNAPWAQASDFGGVTSADANGNGVFDGDEQVANLLTAFAAAVDARPGLVVGGFLWAQTVFYGTPAPAATIDFQVFGRPQEAAVRRAYAAWKSRQPRFPAPSATAYDCLFSWAERTYPDLFSPAGATSAIERPYYYRYYPGTGAYVGASIADSEILYLGPMSQDQLLDLGAAGQWLSTANCLGR